MRPYYPGGTLNALAKAQGGSIPPTPSVHSLRRGLPGYLILFAPHAFVSQSQGRPSKLLSLSVFLPISTDITPTPGILLASNALKERSFEGVFPVERGDFTFDFLTILQTLYAQ